jgi:hypothetical protein
VNLGLVSYLGGSIMVQFGGPLVSARTTELVETPDY